MINKKVTSKQKKALKAIYQSIKESGFPPTLADLKEKLDVSSNQSILNFLGILEKKGYIKRDNGIARGIKILPAGFKLLGKNYSVPIVGTAAAGFAIESYNNGEELINLANSTVLKEKISKNSNFFIVKAQGDSMINAGINNNDLLLAEKTKDVRNGDIVVAHNEDGSTIKRFVSKPNNNVYLKPENPIYPNIKITENTFFEGKIITNLSTQKEAEPVINREKKSKIEKYYKQNDFVLYNGNCIKILNEFPENYFDMIFADPPYMLSNDGFTCYAGKVVSVNKGKWDKSNGIEEDFNFHRQWIKACRRVLKPNGTIWISGTYHSIYSCGYTLQLNGYKILNDICWFKPNASPNLSCRFFTASHETIIWARKNEKGKHLFNYSAMKSGNWHYGDFIKKPDKQMRSVWAIGTPKTDEKKFGKHPTQKPLDLLKRIVLASTKKGDVVLDPFAGSSTTGIASCLNGRKFVGIDMEKKYLDLSIKRYEDVKKKSNNKLI